MNIDVLNNAETIEKFKNKYAPKKRDGDNDDDTFRIFLIAGAALLEYKSFQWEDLVSLLKLTPSHSEDVNWERAEELYNKFTSFLISERRAEKVTIRIMDSDTFLVRG
jgi:hypothetical protein